MPRLVSLNERLSPSGGDDSAEILATATWNNGHVALGPGEFVINGPIRTALPIKLVGAGVDQTRIKCNSSIHGAITLDSGSALTTINRPYFADFEIDGQVDVLGFNEHRHLLSLNGVEGCTIERVRFKGFRGDGVYFGSGADGGQERHNYEIKIRFCEFDGINNDNRNAISIVDCVDALIHDCDFRNVSRANMPGAIDIEPNAFLWHVVNNIRVRDCDFKNIGGNVGVVAFTLNQITLTKAPGSFSVRGCTFDTPNADCIAVVHSNSVRDIMLSVQGNTATVCRRFFNIGAVVRGVSITGNTSYAYAGSLLCGYNSTDKVIDSIVAKNRFFATTDATNSGGVMFSGSDNLTINGNLFRANLLHAIRGGAEVGASIIDTTISGNRAKGLRNSPGLLFYNLGGWDSASCIYEHNGGAGTNLV